jgi:hypothetical protein
MVGDREVHQAGATSYKEDHHRYQEDNDVYGEAHMVITVVHGSMAISWHLGPSCLRKPIPREVSQSDCRFQCSISHHLLLTQPRARGVRQ